jgi:16S rRNA (guanine(527)-N(7))-methyltransferase RsmG
VAESVDARVSEARESNLVEVQIFSSAPFLFDHKNNPRMNEEFLQAVDAHREEFGVEIGTDALASIARYYEFLLSRNDLVHLVAPCSPSEFAVRHVLESLFISGLVSKRACVADVGSGGGLPGIPLAIQRKDIRVFLIESKVRKSDFLVEAAAECGIADRVTVINKQFEEAGVPMNCVVTARALDKFSSKLPKLLKWSGKRKIVLFGGPGLEAALVSGKQRFKKTLIPMSEQRYVFEMPSGRG